MMNIFLDKNYRAEPEAGGFLGVDGEFNSRTLIFRGLTVAGATSYTIEIKLPSGEIITGTIVDGIYTVDGSALTEVGQVYCQITASSPNVIIKKSDIFVLDVLPNLSSVQPLPPSGITTSITTEAAYKAMPTHNASTLYLVLSGETFTMYLGDRLLKPFVELTQAKYDALEAVDPNTLYVIAG